MGRKDLLRAFPWHRYSKKMGAKIENPRAAGYFTPEDAERRGMRFVEGKEGLAEDGNEVHLYLLVDPSDGVIVDAKFQLFGQSALIAAAESACELLIGKNYDQARRMSAELIDRHLRDKPDEEAFPEETQGHLNLVVDAIEDAMEKCLDLPLPGHYVSPVPREIEGKEGGGFPGWMELTQEKKLSVIEDILNEEIRPYIELDAGGIEVLDLIDGKELLISYQGSCTSCYSSIGATLTTIQQILHAKVHPELKVVPNMDDLKFM